MKDILQDIVAHTHSLGFLSTVKVTGEELATTIEAMAEDRSVIVNASWDARAVRMMTAKRQRGRCRACPSLSLANVDITSDSIFHKLLDRSSLYCD